MTKDGFRISILGLGLMGGSLAYALRGFQSCVLTGYDIDPEVLRLALKRGALHRAASTLPEAVADADLVIFCSSPHTILENMRACLPLYKKGAVVTEICGVKRDILRFVSSSLPDEVDYIGLHPMAGKEVGGFLNADPTLFRQAGFLLVLADRYQKQSLELLYALALHVGAGRVVINHADEHDALIAYTSDLMHIAATALCAEYPPDMTLAHTAGAFRDCTRIAKIDPDLWTELLLRNADNILPHLDAYISHLTAVRAAMAREDRPFVHDFLQNASENKSRILTL